MAVCFSGSLQHIIKRKSGYTPGLYRGPGPPYPNIFFEIVFNSKLKNNLVEDIYMTKLYMNTDDKTDIITLDQIRQRYIDINGTDEEFDEYAKNGFYNGIIKEYMLL